MYMNNLIFGKSNISGKGIFANKSFKEGEEIIEFKGELFTYANLPTPYDKVDDHYVQIDKDLYMGPSGYFDDFINHSCDPNSGLKINAKKAILIAIKDIKKGNEITWDYSTVILERDWELNCLWQSKNCRKTIRNFNHLPKEAQQRYIKLGIVPKYIVEDLKQSSK